MAQGRPLCLSLGVARDASDGDTMGAIAGDHRDGGGDGDVLPHLVIPKGEQMKPSYKFRWREGDQYAYYWAMETVTAMSTAMEWTTGMALATETEMEMEMETKAEAYWRVWSSRSVVHTRKP